MFFAGGNELQDLSTTQRYTRTSPRATRAGAVRQYRRRWRKLSMDLLAGDGRTVFWVGQPVMRDGDMDQALQQVNAIAAEEGAARPGITFVDDRTLFTDADGGYAAYLTMPDGQVIECHC